MLKRFITTALFAAAISMPSASVIASDAQSMERLRTLANFIQYEYGVSCRDRARGERLSQGQKYTYSTTLYEGNKYYIFAAGDYSVDDLDIILYDEDWNEIDKDTQTDALPIVEVTPRWTGTFYVRVKMYSGYGYSNFAVCYR
ncbi:hypothetical protein QTP81_07575 [Alteromonas sp. ASW11-36]|uniref:Peptidase C-terminal archaeal/bacterial domain-containing protein n=1 Tax=Alteromonas arenosi TaxID=3055817 RepID=A0ABT7SW84_9ALTE|nr:hypothetical protein [Alteromonas sp. ASW11-36]MDM7860452.1 hypothetical protein [Alteromonas sp. ASW11-36]